MKAFTDQVQQERKQQLKFQDIKRQMMGIGFEEQKLSKEHKEEQQRFAEQQYMSEYHSRMKWLTEQNRLKKEMREKELKMSRENTSKIEINQEVYVDQEAIKLEQLRQTFSDEMKNKIDQSYTTPGFISSSSQKLQKEKIKAREQQNLEQQSSPKISPEERIILKQRELQEQIAGSQNNFQLKTTEALEFDHEHVKQLLQKQKQDTYIIPSNIPIIGGQTKSLHKLNFQKNSQGFKLFVAFSTTIFAFVMIKFFMKRKEELDNFDELYFNFRDEIETQHQKEIDKQMQQSVEELQKQQEYAKMRTLVLIPYEPAPQDPDWLVKKHANKKLDPLETEQYYKFIQDQELKQFWTGKQWGDIPSYTTLQNIMQKYHNLKLFCMTSFQACSGYNPAVFLGPEDECGQMDPFRFWKEYVDERKLKPAIDKLMDHYELPMFVNIGKSKESTNAFFQAKYGMFTCYESNEHFGRVDFDPEFIIYWERQRKNVKNIWYMAMIYAISSGRVTKEDLEPYKKDFKKTKRFQQYLKSHPSHESEVADQIVMMSAPKMFKEVNQEFMDNQYREAVENLKRKVKFYKYNTQNYKTPYELESLVLIEDERILDKTIRRIVRKSQKGLRQQNLRQETKAQSDAEKYLNKPPILDEKLKLNQQKSQSTVQIDNLGKDQKLLNNQNGQNNTQNKNEKILSSNLSNQDNKQNQKKIISQTQRRKPKDIWESKSYNQQENQNRNNGVFSFRGNSM
eukprot:403360262